MSEISGEQSGRPVEELDAQLLDYHLDRLDAPERAAFERRVQADSALREQSEALAMCVRALRAYSAPRAPAGLRERVLARVAAAGAPLKVRRAAGRRRRDLAGVTIVQMQTFRDVLAVAAVVVLMIGVGVPSVLHMRERSQRTLCSLNLGQIGQGLSSYASVFGDKLPFAGWTSRSSWRPTTEPNVVLVPNRRHMYPLVRSAYVATRSFVCPSTKDQPMPSDQVTRCDDFLEARNISYASQNMAGVRPTRSDRPDLPVLGDDNPFFDGGLPLFDVARSLGLADPSQSNSRAHRGAGQNLLTLGGSVRWTISPNAGILGDNIWTLEGVSEYTGREGPRVSTDSHLLK